MPTNNNFTAADLWTMYLEEKSVHRVGDRVGRTGETVRKYLRAAGYRLKGQDWSAAELKILRDWYALTPAAKDMRLDDLARKLGRPKTNVCRKARSLGLTRQARPKSAVTKLPFPETLFKTDEERAKATGERIKKYIAEKGHPRGATGMKVTPENTAKRVAGVKRAWADPNSKFNSAEHKQKLSDKMMRQNHENPPANPFSRAKSGRRADLDNRFFRSAWEANYARYLNWLVARGEIASWDYECQTFWFETIKRGVRSYKPDFKVVENDGSHSWHEVKGWMTPNSATAIKRFKKYYPEEKFHLVDAPWFKQARKSGLASLVGNWE